MIPQDSFIIVAEVDSVQLDGLRALLKTMTFADRTGMVIESAITLVEDDTLELVTVESTGALTPSERAFRESWLGVR